MGQNFNKISHFLTQPKKGIKYAKMELPFSRILLSKQPLPHSIILATSQQKKPFCGGDLNPHLQKRGDFVKKVEDHWFTAFSQLLFSRQMSNITYNLSVGQLDLYRNLANDLEKMCSIVTFWIVCS